MKKLDIYRGRLTPAKVAEGINVAAENAKRLLSDADLLYKAGSFPSAASLAILAIEEAGKVSILRGLSVARTELEVKAAWKDYRSHTKKNVAWILPELAAKGARKMEDLRPMFADSAEHPFLLDQVKQLSFYTDCLGKSHWSQPRAAIDENTARMLIGVARIFAKSKNCSEKEIELWIEHVGPVWKADMEKMKKGVIRWYATMQAAGLAEEGQNQMEQFIHYGVDG